MKGGVMGVLFSTKFIFSRRGIRLRHVFYLGTLIELQAESYYRRFAEKMQDDDVRDLYTQLADEEIRHFKMIDGQLARWKSLPISQKDLNAMDADGKLRQMFLTPPDMNATKKEIIDYAINQEEKMVTFYQFFEKEFNDYWKSSKLQALVAEEKTHIRKLSDMLN
jgi:rubrerythrin